MRGLLDPIGRSPEAKIQRKVISQEAAQAQLEVRGNRNKKDPTGITLEQITNPQTLSQISTDKFTEWLEEEGSKLVRDPNILEAVINIKVNGDNAEFKHAIGQHLELYINNALTDSRGRLRDKLTESDNLAISILGANSQEEKLERVVKFLDSLITPGEDINTSLQRQRNRMKDNGLLGDMVVGVAVKEVLDLYQSSLVLDSSSTHEETMQSDIEGRTPAQILEDNPAIKLQMDKVFQKALMVQIELVEAKNHEKLNAVPNNFFDELKQIFFDSLGGVNDPQVPLNPRIIKERLVEATAEQVKAIMLMKQDLDRLQANYDKKQEYNEVDLDDLHELQKAQYAFKQSEKQMQEAVLFIQDALVNAQPNLNQEPGDLTLLGLASQRILNLDGMESYLNDLFVGGSSGIANEFVQHNSILQRRMDIANNGISDLIVKYMGTAPEHQGVRNFLASITRNNPSVTQLLMVPSYNHISNSYFFDSNIKDLLALMTDKQDDSSQVFNPYAQSVLSAMQAKELSANQKESVFVDFNDFVVSKCPGGAGHIPTVLQDLSNAGSRSLLKLGFTNYYREEFIENYEKAINDDTMELLDLKTDEDKQEYLQKLKKIRQNIEQNWQSTDTLMLETCKFLDHETKKESPCIYKLNVTDSINLKSIASSEILVQFTKDIQKYSSLISEKTDLRARLADTEREEQIVQEQYLDHVDKAVGYVGGLLFHANEEAVDLMLEAADKLKTDTQAGISYDQQQMGIRDRLIRMLGIFVAALTGRSLQTA